MLRLFSFLIMLSVCFACFLGSAFAGSATVSWQANTEQDLKGYNVFIGTVSRNYSESVYVEKPGTSYTFNNLNEGTQYYFCVTALDTSGNESGFSQEVYKTIEDFSAQDVPDQDLSVPSVPRGVAVQ